jgi:hypothetical protein
MSKQLSLVILGLAVAVLVICVSCAIAVGAVAVGTVGQRVLGAGPDRIDLRPTPGAIAPEAALPPVVGGYERGEPQPTAEFRGVALGLEAVEAIYTGSRGSARVIAARLDSYQDVAVAVSELTAQLETTSSLDSHRLVAKEPFRGWWSASGKRNFVFWHALAWETDRHSFAWQSGNWCFIVASNDPLARRDVTLNFPY